jgi:hypothetical protein
MFDARNSRPLSTAIAAGAVARAGGSLLSRDWPHMAQRTAPLPIDRGVTR